ncbi:arylsulfatase [Flavivirga amylovorans]
MKRSLKLFVLLLTIFLLSNAQQKPNVIIMVTDDQGYGDIGAHGNTIINTPAMDKLHSESIRLTNFHVDPSCAPTRAALMSGKYSHHARVWHTVRGGNHMRASEISMADVFQHNGYQTGMFGKWHLGANYPYRPMDRGFEEWLGCGDGGTGTSDCYFWNDRVNDMYWHNGEREYREGFNPDVFYTSAEEYIKKRKKNKPFFIYLPTYIPHKPYTSPYKNLGEQYVKYIGKGIEKDCPPFYALIEHIDGNIAKLRQVLEDEGIADNTIIIFMTDNGSTHGRHAFNAGMSGGKGSTSDGGHRVPFFIHWPKGGITGGKDINTLSAHIDVLPTLAELCGMKFPKAKENDLDGRSLVPLFKDNVASWPDRTIVVEKQREVERNPSNSAIMTQKWRLVGHNKLFDIDNDPGQKNNVFKDHPEVVKKLMADFDKHWQKVTVDDRSFPTPIVGTKHDKEIFLSISELRDGNGFAHGYSASGREAKGVWHIEAYKSGIYEFEVCRWPKEVDATFTGIPEITKKVDAWSNKSPKTALMTSGKLTAIPYGAVSLKVGDEFYEMRDVKADTKTMTFNVKLNKGKTIVDAVFYNKEGKQITNAYYVYVRRK